MRFFIISIVKLPLETKYFEIISSAMTRYFVENNFEKLSTKEFAHLASITGVNFLTDQVIAFCAIDLFSQEIWENIDRKKRIRIAALNIKFAEKFGLQQFDYSIKDILPVLNFNPDYINHITIDFENLSKDDAYALLMLNKQEIREKIEISQHQFTFLETYNILKNSNFNLDELRGLNIENLKSYQLRDLLIYGPIDAINKIDLKKINKVDWLEILKNKPHLLHVCNTDLFQKGDLYDLVLLVIIFDNPDLTHLFDLERIEELTPLGVEKLMIFKTEFAAENCDLDILTESSWNSILAQRPDLSDLRDDVCGVKVKL